MAYIMILLLIVSELLQMISLKRNRITGEYSNVLVLAFYTFFLVASSGFTKASIGAPKLLSFLIVFVIAEAFRYVFHGKTYTFLEHPQYSIRKHITRILSESQTEFFIKEVTDDVFEVTFLSRSDLLRVSYEKSPLSDPVFRLSFKGWRKRELKKHILSEIRHELKERNAPTMSKLKLALKGAFYGACSLVILFIM